MISSPGVETPWRPAPRATRPKEASYPMSDYPYADRFTIPCGHRQPAPVQAADPSADRSPRGHMERSEPLAGVSRRPSALPVIDPRAGAIQGQST